MKDNNILLAIISILSDGEYHSSIEIRKYFGINQTTINKYIKILIRLGINLFFIPGKGYSLYEPIQLLNKNLIQDQIKQNSINVLTVIDSTNQYLLNRIDILNSGDVCIAECQKNGRGRRGRKWFSPFGSNLYLSMYWHLKSRLVEVISLSLVVSVIIAEVLHDLGAVQVQLKWPNDIYLLDRKLAGVLIELTNRKINESQIVIGIGINLTMKASNFRKINQNWINLQESGINIDRNLIAIRLIKALQNSLKHFEEDGFKPFFNRWKKFNNSINHTAKLILDSQEIHGIFRGLNKQWRTFN